MSPIYLYLIRLIVRRINKIMWIISLFGIFEEDLKKLKDPKKLKKPLIFIRTLKSEILNLRIRIKELEWMLLEDLLQIIGSIEYMVLFMRVLCQTLSFITIFKYYEISHKIISIQHNQ